jgi:hypothetical protein
MQLDTDREEHENQKDDVIQLTRDWVGWKEVYSMEIVLLYREIFHSNAPNFLNAYSVVTDLALQIQIGKVRGFYSKRLKKDKENAQVPREIDVEALVDS